MWTQLLETLPKIAGEPLAILAYMLVVVAWLYWLVKRIQTRTFLVALEKIAESERKGFSEQAGYRYDELSRLTRDQRYSLIIRRYRLFGLAASLIALIILVAILINGAEEVMTLRVRLQQIDGERAKLQTLLDAHLRTRNQVAVGVAGLAGELSASDDPEIKTGASRLQTLVDDLIKDHSLDDLPMDQAWVVRVAQGTAAIGRGDFDAALQHVPSKALADLRNLEIVALKVRGDAYYGKREWSNALNAYTQLTTLQPGDLQARLLAGNCQVHIGRVEDAERTYTEAIALPPNTPVGQDENVWRVAALNNRGNLHSMAGRYAQALEDFSRGLHTLRALPTNENRQIGTAVLLANRGYVLQQLTRTKEANADRAEARRLVASVPRARQDVIEWLDERTTPPVASHNPRQTPASRQATAPKLASAGSADDVSAPGSPSQAISAGVTGTSKPVSPESQPGPVGSGGPVGTSSKQSEPKHAAQKNCFMCHAAEPSAPASPK